MQQLEKDNISSEKGILRYLSSGLIRGIGPSTAVKIVEMFGTKSLDIIANHSERLGEIPGIGPQKIKTIAESWDKQKDLQDIVLFLERYEISLWFAIKIYKHYGNDGLQIIRKNPYQLASDIKGIGFVSADRIALSLDIPYDSPIRAKAALEYILTETINGGSCCIPANELIRNTVKNLNVPPEVAINALCDGISDNYFIAVDQVSNQRLTSISFSDKNGEITKEKIQSILHQAIDVRTIKSRMVVSMLDGIKDDEVEIETYPMIFLAPYFYIERGIAKRIKELSDFPSIFSGKIDIASSIEWLQGKYGVLLAEGQKDALKTILNNKVSIVTGGPGTGKTTLVLSLLRILREFMPDRQIKIKLAAPTGRAAKRLGESTYSTALTIHRLLEFDPIQMGFRYHDRNLLSCDWLILDESSMIDAKLMYALLKALPLGLHLVIVGDTNQLPSVGAGQVLSDMIGSHTLPVVHLTQIFRQAVMSEIVRGAHLINSGIVPKFKGNEKIEDEGLVANSNDENHKGKQINRRHDCVFVEVKSTDNIIENLLNVVRFEIHPMAAKLIKNGTFDFAKDMQILSPMQKGPAGVKNLNQILQKYLNRSIMLQRYVERFGVKYYVGDKVMQTENNYNKAVFNGDIGFITKINYDRQQIVVHYDGRDVDYTFNEISQLVHAYAITIHKSQGSEYPVVVIPILTAQYIMLSRNLIYTALTRAKNLAVLVGQRKALAIAVNNNDVDKRYSMLKNWLIEQYTTTQS